MMRNLFITLDIPEDKRPLHYAKELAQLIRSDNEFHCIGLLICLEWYKEREGAHLHAWCERDKEYDVVPLNTKFDRRINIQPQKGSNGQAWDYIHKNWRVLYRWRLDVNHPIGCMNEPISDMFKGVIWKPFQKEMIEAMMQTVGPDYRTVLWYYSYAGNVGKTFAVKWLVAHTGAMLAAGTKENIADALRNYKDAHHMWPNSVIWNVPRGCARISTQMIENVLDGTIVCSKYKGESFNLMPRPVLVVANRPPSKEERESLSDDRWFVRNCDPRVIKEEPEENPLDIQLIEKSPFEPRDVIDLTL